MHRTLVAIAATAALLTSLLAGLVATSPTAHATNGAAGLNEVESQSRAGEQDWIEIVNVSGADLSIGGWKVRDLEGNSFTVPSGIALHPDGRYVFEVGSVLGADDMAILIDSTGNQVDWFHWFEHAASGTWSRCVEGMGSFLDSAPSKGAANPCRGPDITASISSDSPKTANGWYGSPVTVTYACTAGNAAISVCSLPQTLSSTGADQDVVGSVFDTNGASDKIRVTGINIDRQGPTLVIKGVVKNKKYDTKQTPKVKAADPHSGLAKTKVYQKPKVSAEGTKWSVYAYAVDQAGNMTKAHLKYWVWA